MEFYNNDGEDYRKIAKHEILTPMIKIELLDHYENTYAELVEEISAENIGTISETFKQGVRKTISLTIFDPDGIFIPNPNDKYFWMGRKFKVYLGLSKTRYYSADNPLLYSYSEEDFVAYLKTLNVNTDGKIIIGQNLFETEEDIYWFTKGVYVLTDVNAVHNGANKTVSISGVDKFGLFTSDTGFNEMVGTFVIEEGTPVPAAVIDILNQDTGNGNVIDPIEPIIDPYFRNAVVMLELSKGPGSYMGDIMIDLANAFQADIFYDDEGRLNFWHGMIGEENNNLPVIWQFFDTDPEYISSSVHFNYVKTANAVYVVGDNPTAAKAPEAWAYNNNPESPLCIQNVGQRSKYIESSSIRTTTEAADYANYQLKMLTLVQHTISFECTFLPHLSVDKLFELTDNFYHFMQRQFVIESVTFPLGQGTIRLSGCDIQELPGY